MKTDNFNLRANGHMTTENSSSSHFLRIVLGFAVAFFIAAFLVNTSSAFAEPVDEQNGLLGSALEAQAGDAQLAVVTYEVKFETSGGSTVATQTIEAGYLVIKPDDPTKNGYKFAGWYTDQNLTTQFNFSLPVNSNLTIYAGWTAKSTDITDSNGDAYVVDPTQEKCIVVSITDLDYNNLSGCSVTVDLNGAYTVDLTSAALSEVTTKGVIVTVKSEDGVKQKNKSVTCKRSNGKVLGTQLSDTLGQCRFEIQIDTTRIRMYRLYNKWTGEHFYTKDAAEQIDLVRAGWTDEGTGWYAPKSTLTPVYRLYNKYVSGGDHHYTMDETERDACIQAGWTYEGIAWYSPDDTDDAKPLYRQYNPNAVAGSHNYTLNKDEADKVVKAGWRDEGTAWYGYESE